MFSENWDNVVETIIQIEKNMSLFAPGDLIINAAGIQSRSDLLADAKTPVNMKN